MELKDWINIALTAIMVLATIVYVVYTYKLVKESRKTREHNLEAHIIAYLVNAETSPSLVTLIIENIGNGVARKVEGRIIRDIQKNRKSLNDFGLFQKKFEYFPSGYSLKYFLLTLTDNYEERTEDYIEFELSYSDALNKNKKQRFKVEFKDVKGIGMLTPPDTYQGMIAYRLEKIQKILDKK